MTNEEKEKQIGLETKYKETFYAHETAKAHLEQFNKEMIEAEINRKRKKEPKQFENYFRINVDGHVEHTVYDSEYDAMAINLGNYGLTEEECKAKKERMRVNELLERYAKESGEVIWECNEKGSTSTKYTLTYNYMDNRIATMNTRRFRSNNSIYFNSHDVLLRAIKEIGEARIVSALFQA